MINLIKKYYNYLILQTLKIYNLSNLWFFSENQWFNPFNQVECIQLSDRDTLLYLKKNSKVGIIRNGNSELGLIVGNSPKTQKYDKRLRDKLVNNFRNYNHDTIKKYILGLPLDSLIVGNNKRGLPNWYPGRASRLAMKFLVKKNLIYASPFCFRVEDIIDDDITSYIRLVKSLFVGRNIIYVGPMKEKNAQIPEFLNPKKILKIPVKNAFKKYDSIFTQIKKYCKNYNNPLVVVVGGTTASVLSYDLNMSGITCYDFGQFQRIYQKNLNK